MESVAHPSLDTPLIEHLTDLGQARQIALGCVRCDLAATRTQVVFGEGVPTARLMLVGEGPGAEEDRQGRPFVGRAGQLLDAAIAQAGLSRDQVRHQRGALPAGEGVGRASGELAAAPARSVPSRVDGCRAAPGGAARALPGRRGRQGADRQDLRLLEARGQWLSGPRGSRPWQRFTSYVLRQRIRGSRPGTPHAGGRPVTCCPRVDTGIALCYPTSGIPAARSCDESSLAMMNGPRAYQIGACPACPPVGSGVPSGGWTWMAEYPWCSVRRICSHCRVVTEDGRVVSHVGVSIRDASILGCSLRWPPSARSAPTRTTVAEATPALMEDARTLALGEGGRAHAHLRWARPLPPPGLRDGGRVLRF